MHDTHHRVFGLVNLPNQAIVQAHLLWSQSASNPDFLTKKLVFDSYHPISLTHAE